LASVHRYSHPLPSLRHRPARRRVSRLRRAAAHIIALTAHAMADDRDRPPAAGGSAAQPPTAPREAPPALYQLPL